MRATTGLYILMAIALAGCKGSNFAGKGQSSRQSAAAEAASTGTTDTDDEVIALEPTSVGGAFLGCFVDPQIPADLFKDQPADGVAVGCQAFDDANFSRVLGRGGLIVESGEIQVAGARQVLKVQSMEKHPRWAWITRIPAQALSANLYLNLRANTESRLLHMRVELLDILPAAVAGQALALTSGSYRLRLKGTSACLNGNPVWAWDDEQKPITDTLQTKACAEALRFRFTSFGKGLRMHVPNPEPDSCDTQNFAVEHCNDSCVDLENFGLGNRFSLWACTLSAEAQSFIVISGSKGAARFQVNGRFINLVDQLILPALDAAVEVEIIPVPLP